MAQRDKKMLWPSFWALHIGDGPEGFDWGGVGGPSRPWPTRRGGRSHSGGAPTCGADCGTGWAAPGWTWIAARNDVQWALGGLWFRRTPDLGDAAFEELIQ